MAAAFAPLRRPLFAAIWGATLVSNTGGMIQTVGASWMMATIADSSGMIALVQTAALLPIMIFSLAAGAIADLFDRRRIMLAAQMFMFGVSVALAAIAYAGLVTPWLLIAMTFALGSGLALHGPAWQASVGEHVPRDELAAAVALNATGFNIARSAGPALGGVIVAAAGASAAFAVNAVSYLPLITVLGRWRREPMPRTLPAERFARAVVTGVRFVAWATTLRGALVRGLAFGLGASGAWALMPLIARDRLGGDAIAYGLLLATFGAGAIAGALASTPARSRFGSEALVRGAFLGSGAATIILALSTVLPISATAAAIAGAGWSFTLSTCNATVQLFTPRWVVARALAVYQTCTFGGLAIGSWAWGFASDVWGLIVALMLAGIVLCGGALIGLILPLPDGLALDLSPAAPHSGPDDVHETADGSVIIRKFYRVRPDEIPSFLQTMKALRLVRLRNGARQWSLIRPIEIAGEWIETFRVLDPLELRRLYRRMTVADAKIEAMARSSDLELGSQSSPS